MEIDSHILGLSMEFEKQNIIITEWETEKAKTKSDHIYERRKRKRIRKRQPKIYLEPTDSEPNDEDEEEEYDDCDDAKNDDNESGFEVRFKIQLKTCSNKCSLQSSFCEVKMFIMHYDLLSVRPSGDACSKNN